MLVNNSIMDKTLSLAAISDNGGKSNLINFINKEKITNLLMKQLDINIDENNYNQMYDILSNIENLFATNEYIDHGIASIIRKYKDIVNTVDKDIIYYYYFRIGQIFSHQYKNKRLEQDWNVVVEHIYKFDLDSVPTIEKIKRRKRLEISINEKYEQFLNLVFKSVKSVDLTSDYKFIKTHLYRLIKIIERTYGEIEVESPIVLKSLTEIIRSVSPKSEKVNSRGEKVEEEKLTYISAWEELKRKHAQSQKSKKENWTAVNTVDYTPLIEAKKKLTFFILGALMNNLSGEEIRKYIHLDQL